MHESTTPALPDEATASQAYLDARKNVATLAANYDAAGVALNKLGIQLDFARRALTKASDTLTAVHDAQVTA